MAREKTTTRDEALARRTLMSKLLGRDESGQALAEFGLIAPVLVLMLGGIVYCGGLILTQENLSIAARSAARRQAIDGTKKMLASGTMVNPGSPQSAAREASGNMSGIKATGVNWGNVDLKNGRVLNTNVALYAKTGSIQIGKKKYRCGVGCLLYGVKVTKDLSKDLSPVGKLVTTMGGRLAGVTSLGAVGVMPGDLPPRGDASVMGLNNWITDIVNADPKSL